LERLGQPCLQPFIHVIRAGAAQLRGQTDTARALLTRAAEGFAGAGLNGLIAATRRRLGMVCGGAQGQELVRTAEDWMRGQQVANPARFTAMLVPGFGDAGIFESARPSELASVLQRRP
jgi:hypothetical protein